MFGICLGTHLEYQYRDEVAQLPQLVESPGHMASVEVAMAGLDSYEHATTLRRIGFTALALGGVLCVIGVCATSQKRRHDVIAFDAPARVTVSSSGRVELSSPKHAEQTTARESELDAIRQMTRDDWLRLLVLPFKAYVFIMLLPLHFIFEYHRVHHTAPSDTMVFLLHGLFLCAVILLTAAFMFWLWGPKRHAWLCFVFGFVAAVQVAGIVAIP